MPQETIVKVQFSYRVQHVPKGKRNPVSYDIMDEVPVALATLTAAEAPTALRFVPPEWRTSEEKADHPWYGGELYGPLRRDYSGQEKTATFDDLLAAVARANETGDDRDSPFHAAPSVRNYDRNFVLPEAIPPGRTRDDGSAARAETIAKIARRAAEMILVDGKVYEKTEEPVYAWHVAGGFFGGGRRNEEEPCYHAKTVKVSEIRATDNPGLVFRADRLDDVLVEIAEHENRRRQAYGHAPLTDEELLKRCVWNPIEVLIPEAVRFRYDMRPRLAREAGIALENMKGDIAARDVAYFRAYAALRDLMAAEPLDHGALAALLPSVAEAMRGGHPHTADALGRVLKEWANRDDPAALPESDMDALAAAG